MKGVGIMPTIIYTDAITGENGMLINTTPAGKYAVANLDTILDCIAKGEIVCGTGQPYPVNWNDEDNAPWNIPNMGSMR